MAAATLQIRLLGELDPRHGEVPVPPLGSARAESLLADLLHRDAAQPRQRLAFVLWPTPASPRPGPPTCAICCTTCAGPSPTPTGTSR